MQDKSKYRSSGRLELQKLPQPSKKFFLFTFSILLVLVGLAIFRNLIFAVKQNLNLTANKFNLATASPIPTPTPSPTPKPLTFAEMNTLYGPCAFLPTIFYHHIQSSDAAKANKQTNLTVYTSSFQSQMQYLKDKGYNVLTMSDLINFFDNGVAVPKHSILLTFDDGYGDFYSDAYPVLSSLGFHATMFTPTGLMNNPGYLTWDQISGMNGLIFFANHTWSHKNVQVSGNVMRTEISTADAQLADHGLNTPKVFAFPYGLSTPESEAYLASLGYKLAFTTVPGNILCKKQRFALPRIRIGNSPLSSYGF